MSRHLLLAFLLPLTGCVSSINSLTGRETNQRSTFLLRIPTGGQCSGVVLTREGYILTAGHCVRGHVESLIVQLDNGTSSANARVIAVDSNHDLALLKVDDMFFNSFARLHSGRVLRTGDTVYHSGFPFGGRHGLPQLFGVGHIMNPDATLDHDPSRHFIMIDLQTGRPGASGSGAYDGETGGLIGMVDAIMVLSGGGRDSMTIVLLVPVGYIKEFLLSNGLHVPSVGVGTLLNSLNDFPPEVSLIKREHAQGARNTGQK